MSGFDGVCVQPVRISFDNFSNIGVLFQDQLNVWLKEPGFVSSAQELFEFCGADVELDEEHLRAAISNLAHAESYTAAYTMMRAAIKPDVFSQDVFKAILGELVTSLFTEESSSLMYNSDDLYDSIKKLLDETPSCLTLQLLRCFCTQHGVTLVSAGEIFFIEEVMLAPSRPAPRVPAPSPAIGCSSRLSLNSPLLVPVSPRLSARWQGSSAFAGGSPVAFIAGPEAGGRRCSGGHSSLGSFRLDASSPPLIRDRRLSSSVTLPSAVPFEDALNQLDADSSRWREIANENDIQVKAPTGCFVCFMSAETKQAQMIADLRDQLTTKDLKMKSLCV